MHLRLGPHAAIWLSLTVAAISPDASALTCVRVHVRMATPANPAGQAWLKGGIEYARRVFAPAGLDFNFQAPAPLPKALHQIDSKGRRDRVGRRWWRRGQILVLAPVALVDTNGRDRRHGVHWRDRSDRRAEDRRRRWLIVAQEHPEPTPMPFVLAHELGHFFGLPHAAAPESLMNKSGGAGRPPPLEWRFTKAELGTIRRRLGQMRNRGYLTTRPCSVSR